MPTEPVQTPQGQPSYPISPRAQPKELFPGSSECFIKAQPVPNAQPTATQPK